MCKLISCWLILTFPSIHSDLLPTQTLSLIARCNLTSSFAPVIITTVTRGHRLTKNKKVDWNKLLALMAYTVMFLGRMFLCFNYFNEHHPFDKISWLLEVHWPQKYLQLQCNTQSNHQSISVLITWHLLCECPQKDFQHYEPLPVQSSDLYLCILILNPVKVDPIKCGKFSCNSCVQEVSQRSLMSAVGPNSCWAEEAFHCLMSKFHWNWCDTILENSMCSRNMLCIYKIKVIRYAAL